MKKRNVVVGWLVKVVIRDYWRVDERDTKLNFIVSLACFSECKC